MSAYRSRSLYGACGLLCLLLAGCSKGNVIPMTGVLKYKGTPVPNAYIEFLPDQGRQTWAQTDEQGRFKVNYDAHQDGIVVGKNKVWVKMRPMTAAEKEADMIHGHGTARSKDLAVFYDKYGPDKSTHVVEITPDTRELILNLD